MILNYNALDDYLHALQNKRDRFWAADKDDEADRLQDTLDSFGCAINKARYGGKLSPESAQELCRVVFGLTAPSDIQALVPLHRWNSVYRATMKLGDLLARAEQGKPIRRILGLTF